LLRRYLMILGREKLELPLIFIEQRAKPLSSFVFLSIHPAAVMAC
jgi:hypothetical protein